MSDFEEDLDDFPMFPAEYVSKTSNLWLLHIAHKQKINEQLHVESLRKFLHSVVGQLLSSSMRSWSMIGRILQCLKQENEDQHWRTDLSKMQKCTKDFSIENLWEQKMESSASRYFEIPFNQRSSENFPLEFVSQFSWARRGNIEMDKWIGKFSHFLKRLRDVWMDMLWVRNKEKISISLIWPEKILEDKIRNEEVLDPYVQATEKF